ncbi:MAG: hypothetical protein A2511_09655 [Deltaproteobacteria bacterium RIFOXYD12_FULL_50_9]|nr:MAG: hypothetical protein A2511_09655 [Deltaproteobacteria bacterium RIFOXYD12_FULL_50_9]
MLKLPSGIRKKVILGFYLILSFLMITAFLTYGIVKRVEHKVESMEVIDDFLKTTLELRRFEKNYFLYNKEEDFNDSMKFWDELESHLFKNNRMLSALMTTTVFKRLWETVHEYRRDMLLLHKQDQHPLKKLGGSIDRVQLEAFIRTQGKELTDTAEKVSRNERRTIHALLKTTGTILILSILTLVILCVGFVAILGRNILSSLNILHDHTRRISRGEFVTAPLHVDDQEINSLLQAFNRMTNELRVRQQQLVQSEKLAALGTLLSGVAHELNNPLSNISTSAQILKEELLSGDPEFNNNLISQVIEQSDRARDIVRTLLEFSRTSEFHSQKIVFRQLVEETIILLRGHVPTEVDIALEIPVDLELFADKQRLKQVFLNLIKNALDVIGDQGRIWISAQEIHKEAGSQQHEIEIMINDNGPGIQPENLAKIFDPFFTTKDVGHGSGLGLFIVHDIIELHGGTIRVESRPGEGTTFIIWLPYNQGEHIND